MNIQKLLNDFMTLVGTGEIEIYNEFSMQHELGIFLRANLTGYKVQFERNAKFLGIRGTVKHEIDIVIYNNLERYAIELKYPLNGQYPEQMFSFVKDIKFMEEMKESGFKGAYCLTLVEDKNFYTGQKKDGIYGFFRGGESIHGLICKPTGKKDEQLKINGEHRICWRTCNDMKYYIVEIS